MRSLNPKVLAVAAALIASSVAALAGNTPLWSQTKGGLNFPITPPSNGGATPGTLDNTTIGSSIPAGGRFLPLSVDSGTKTAAATSGAATLNKAAGAITSESVTTAAGSDYTLTLTDSAIAAADQVMASVQLGTSTTGEPAITSVTPAAGSVVIKVRNIAASAAFNGTIIISFVDLAN